MRNQKNKKFPGHGYAGILLIVIFWILNWGLEGPRTHIAFFPLWLGFCLVADALVYLRTGTSPKTRNSKFYVLLFIISVAAWWLFELYNQITHNWIYIGKEEFSDFMYFVYASVNFSIVIPAVFTMAELVRSFRWMDRFKNGPVIKPTSQAAVIMLLAGVVMLVLLLLFPRYFFPFIWGNAYLIIEAFNIFLGNKTLLDYTAKKDWRPVISLMTGCLITGFFWEMWNFYSFPKWIYNVPFVDFLHIFEMPVIGFIGYLPFSLELFAIYNFFAGIIDKDRMQNYIKL